MAVDPRRFDDLAKVVADERRHLNDVEGTVMSRFSSHTHKTPLVVSSTASVTNPYTGQVIFNTTDNMLYRYDGAAWVAFLATGGGTSATTHEARYEQTTFQTIATGTDTKLAFNNPITTTNDVTASGTGNTDFLLNRAGLWRVSASLRYVVGTTGERDLFMATGTTIGTLANRFVGQSDGAVGGGAGTLSVSTDIRVAAGTSVFAGTFQNNGGGLATEVGFGHTVHIALSWQRP
jgi:hypothetical protein